MSDDNVIEFISVRPGKPGGDPIREGVAKRITLRDGRDGIEEYWDEPVMDPPKLSDAQMAQIVAIADAWPGSFVRHSAGRRSEIIIQLIRDDDDDR